MEPEEPHAHHEAVLPIQVEPIASQPEELPVHEETAPAQAIYVTEEEESEALEV